MTHAASYALADRSDVLRVLISASPETRAHRIAEAKGWSDSDAAKAVARGDAGRADYLKRFYDIDAELPTHYDIVIDTDQLDAVAAADLIVSAARSQPVVEPPTTIRRSSARVAAPAGDTRGRR